MSVDNLNRTSDFRRSQKVKIVPKVQQYNNAKNINNYQSVIVQPNNPIIQGIKKAPSKKYKRNITKNTSIAILATLLATGSIALASNTYNNHYNSRDIQNEIREATLAKLESPFETEWNGESFSIQLPCDRPELYNVLKESNLDEILNDYLKNPTTKAKELLFSQLEGREEELAEFNMNLIRASFADSQHTTMDNIDIDVTFRHNDAEHRNEIANGTKTYIGQSLNINTPKHSAQSYLNSFEYNYDEIPVDLSTLLTRARLQEEAPNSSYFENDKLSKLERALKTYKEIKKILNDYNLTIEEGKVCLVKNNKTYSYSKDIFGRTSINKNNNDIDNER